MVHRFQTLGVLLAGVVQPIIAARPKILCDLGLVESNGVDFTTFQPKGTTKRWWQTYEEDRPVGSLSFSWAQFMHFFLEKFILLTRGNELCRQFEHLAQGSISVTQHEMRFTQLSCYSSSLVSNEKKKVQRFIEGLHFGIRLGMAREAEIETTFHQALEVTRRLECIRIQGREEHEAKKPRTTGGFSGASSGGKGYYDREHHARLV
ncbi:uncharacterized protein [Nicotiana tomentosiformis]|uniref:uncharacterized protein n=1 Tax=Nicotiana tomentosiformis TaxID=4098 RepID=UPI00388CBDE7